MFIIGDHYGITSLLTFYLPEARAQVKDAPLVFCQPARPTAKPVLFLARLHGDAPGAERPVRSRSGTLEAGFRLATKWLNGETNLLAATADTGPRPNWLIRQFDSVTNTGLHPVLYRGTDLAHRWKSSSAAICAEPDAARL